MEDSESDDEDDADEEGAESTATQEEEEQETVIIAESAQMDIRDSIASSSRAKDRKKRTPQRMATISGTGGRQGKHQSNRSCQYTGRYQTRS